MPEKKGTTKETNIVRSN